MLMLLDYTAYCHKKAMQAKEALFHHKLHSTQCCKWQGAKVTTGNMQSFLTTTVSHILLVNMHFSDLVNGLICFRPDS